MKVYVFYLIIPDRFVENLPENDRENFECIVKGFSMLNRQWIDELNTFSYLYAFTDDKKYANRFKEERNNEIFFMKSFKMTKDEYEQFRRDNKSAHLKYRIVSDGVQLQKMLLTNNEQYDIDDTLLMFFNDEVSSTCYAGYDFLKSKYIKALDTILYCTDYCIHYTSDSESVSYNWGYGITAESTHSGIGIEYDMVKIFVKYYKHFFKEA